MRRSSKAPQEGRACYLGRIVKRMGLRFTAGLVILGACSSPSAPPAPGVEPADDAGASESGTDAGASDTSADRAAQDGLVPYDASDAPWVVAAHPAMPQVIGHGGPVLKAPVFTAVTFPSYDLTSVVENLLSTIGASPYWASVTSEYGVGPGSAAPPVHLTESAPAAIDDSGIQACGLIRARLADRLEPRHHGALHGQRHRRSP
jgi:hypothetical protein